MRLLTELEARVVRGARLIALVGLAGLLVQAVVTMLDVLLRWLLNQPIKGLHDMSELAIVIVLAACFPVVVAQRQNITIRFLGHAFGLRGRLWLDALGSWALLAFLALAGWQLSLYTGELVAAGRTTWLLQIPVAPYWVVATVVFGLCLPAQAVVALADVGRAIAGVPAADPRETLSVEAAASETTEVRDRWIR